MTRDSNVSKPLKEDYIIRIKSRIEQHIDEPMEDEEKEEFDSVCKKHGIDLISLIAPTSHERVAQIAKDAEGFVYCVSSLGVTGTRTNITTDIGAMVKLVKAVKDISCAVGFGISTPEQAKKMAAQSDGAIVGSAIVKLCAEHGADCVPYVKEYVKSMKDAVMEA